MYSTHNEGKSVIAERFIRILKNKTYKCMTSISKYAYIDKLDDIVNKYISYHNMFKNQTHILTQVNELKTLNSKLVILLEYQNMKIFLQKVTFQIGLKKFSWLRKLKILCCEHVITDLNGEEIFVTFYENKLQKKRKKNQKEFRIEKVIKRKSDKLCVKRKRYNNSFNGWIDKKEIV